MPAFSPSSTCARDTITSVSGGRICHKAAFKTEFGIFVPNVMFFGLTNSPATFQRMMDSIFQCTIDKHHILSTEILIYMDDILIASSQASRAIVPQSMMF
jgi:hypothetical protein